MSRLLDILSTYGLFLGIPLLFLLIVFWIYRPGSARRYQADGRLPFEEGEGPDGNRPADG
ncbi:MAG: cbb3-type cytochrome c oxidase subunit 3 [Gallionellaceae bacterium]|nr:cbb3-type cytochrome c oxidase subunit 3 [Gallionellaceae bacterium]MDD5364197.1 cbb3-type cytochrome c oxidase subunit 3 [Gallionellaceae bacterium]